MNEQEKRLAAILEEQEGIIRESWPEIEQAMGRACVEHAKATQDQESPAPFKFRVGAVVTLEPRGLDGMKVEATVKWGVSSKRVSAGRTIGGAPRLPGIDANSPACKSYDCGA